MCWLPKLSRARGSVRRGWGLSCRWCEPGAAVAQRRRRVWWGDTKSWGVPVLGALGLVVGTRTPPRGRSHPGGGGG